jgi:hypothetical protein
MGRFENSVGFIANGMLVAAFGYGLTVSGKLAKENKRIEQRNLQLQQYIQNQGLSENNLTGFPLQVALLSQDIFQPEKR